MNDNDRPRCPFVYANGRRCCGEVEISGSTATYVTDIQA